MSADGLAERTALGPAADGLTFAELGHRARRAGTLFAGLPVAHVVVIDENSPAVPIALFGAAASRQALRPGQLPAGRRPPAGHRPPGDPGGRHRWPGRGRAVGRARRARGDRPGRLPRARATTRSSTSSTGGAATPTPSPSCCSPAARPAIPRRRCSGTATSPRTSCPRVEFGGAGEDEAAIVSVPPYHIAGIASVLSTTYQRPPGHPARVLRPAGLGGRRPEPSR